MFKITYDKKYAVTIKFVNDQSEGDVLKKLYDNGLLEKAVGSTYADINVLNEGILYASLQDDADLEDLRTLGFNLVKQLEARKIKNVSADLSILDQTKQDEIVALVEGFLQAGYQFNYYKKEKKNLYLETLSLDHLNIESSFIDEIYALISSQFKARDFVNLTPIDLYPESYANMIVDLFKDTHVKVTVYDEKQIHDFGMHALLAVAKGSDLPPRFVKLEYFNDDHTDTHLTFVGKGVTYDSGGYAIKPATSMVDMKSDMAGSAAVVGAIKALNDNHIKTNVVGLIALTENMIDGKAYKNGDIIKTMKGLTVEIINTDAEGRLTLADAIYFGATKLKSKSIIELSTLTGACVTALGNHITGIVTKDDSLYHDVHHIGIKTGEFNWRLPITKSLEKAVKGQVGDLKNAIPGGAGAITAGIFLNHFNENIPYIHLDIAGPSFGAPHLYYSNGASGVGVKTLYYFAKNQTLK